LVGGPGAVVQGEEHVVGAGQEDPGAGGLQHRPDAVGHVQVDLFLDQVVGEVADAPVGAAVAGVEDDEQVFQDAVRQRSGGQLKIGLARPAPGRGAAETLQEGERAAQEFESAQQGAQAEAADKHRGEKDEAACRHRQEESLPLAHHSNTPANYLCRGGPRLCAEPAGKRPRRRCRGLLGASLGALGAAVTGRNRRDGASVYRFCRCSMMNQITTMRPINESMLTRSFPVPAAGRWSYWLPWRRSAAAAYST